jgi:hypothetical protein
VNAVATHDAGAGWEVEDAIDVRNGVVEQHNTLSCR